MAWDPLSLTETQTRKPITQALLRKIKNDLDYLYGQIAGLAAIGIPNKNFEHDADGDGVPDNWTVTLYPAGTQGLSATESASGKNGLYFTHPGGAGNGGGWAESDYVEINPLRWHAAYFSLKCTNPATKCQAIVRYFDQDKVWISDEILYESINNPTSLKYNEVIMAMPENARYAKMRLVGGATDVDQAGTVYFDEVGFGINPTLSFSLTPGSLRIRDSDSVIATRLSPWVKVREHVMARGGTVSVTFSLKGGSHLDPINGSTVADMIYGRIYVNGVAVGTQRQTNDYTLYTAWTEDITVKPGDRLQLYVYVPNSSYCYTSLFQIGVAELLESAAGATM